MLLAIYAALQMFYLQQPAQNLTNLSPQLQAVPWEVNCVDDVLENGYINQGYCIPGLITREAWLVTSPSIITGALSSYDPGMMEMVANNREMSLKGFKDGIALMSCVDIGKVAWIQRPGHNWDGPFLVVDCSSREDMYVNTVIKQLVGEVGYKTAQEWGQRSWGYVKVSVGQRGGEFGWSYANWWLDNAFAFVWKPMLNRVSPDRPVRDVKRQTYR